MPSISASAPPPVWTPSTIILNDFSKDFVSHANTRLGPWLLGALTDMLLQGILLAQTTKYFTYTTGDAPNRRFVYLVSVLAVLCILKSIQNIYVIWITVITHFVDPDTASRLVVDDWGHVASSLSTAVIASVVQSFFIYRYWLLTKRLWVCIIIYIAVIISMVASSLVVNYLLIPDIPAVEKWAVTHFASAVIADALITSLTAYHLYQQKAMVYSAAASATPSYASFGRTTMETRIIQSTSQMINRLMLMVWQSAFPPLICVIINMALLLSFPIDLTHMIFNMALPKLYAISLMYTLNTGIEMRSERTTNYGVTTQRDSIPRNAPTPLALRLAPSPTTAASGETELALRKKGETPVRDDGESWDISK